MRRSPKRMLLDAEQHRRNASNFADLAETTPSTRERDHFARMAKTSELLAKNAEWMKSIDDFLSTLRKGSSR